MRVHCWSSKLSLNLILICRTLILSKTPVDRMRGPFTVGAHNLLSMKPSLSLLPLTAALLLVNGFAGSSLASSPPPIPMHQLGAVAGKQYQGDGLSVRATATGAELRCAFQRLEGEVTTEGLWLRSTADGAAGERFRVLATGVGRDLECAAGSCCGSADWQSAVSRIGNPQAAPGWSVQPTASRRHSRLPTCATAERPVAMPAMGRVETSENVTRFIRTGLTEEYSVSVDGVRQDFLIAQPPIGTGELRLELDVTGATVTPLGNGLRLTLAGSGRQLAYHRLHVTDATGRELPARMEVAAEMPAATKLTVLVDDANAVYPVRIDPTFSDANWVSMGGIPGADGAIYAAVTDTNGNLYIGGNFRLIGEVLANRVAKWNGSSWSALGKGMNVTVYALAVSDNNLYAGGGFTTADDNGANYVAKWNGSAWSAMGAGMNNWVYALAVSGSNVYAGGNFTTAGGSLVNYIAKWSNENWSALGSGLDNFVRALAVSGGDLYVGGYFFAATNINGTSVTVNRIAKWNGSSWLALGPGMNNFVLTLASSGADLYAGGGFTMAGSAVVNYVAKWDGSAWSALGAGMRNTVYALAVSGGELYAGGPFAPVVGGSSTTNLAKWNGSVWTSLSSGVDSTVSALAVAGTELFVGGEFVRATNTSGVAIPVNRIAKWNLNGWSAVGWSGSGSGTDGPVYALAALGTNLYAGGSFWTAAGTLANFIAKWDGISWSSPSSGVNSSVLAFAPSGNDLYAGGVFTTAGGSPASRIAKWCGSNWSALGLGMNNTVRALAISGADLYAGGDFTASGGNTLNYISMWSGGIWSPLGAGLNSNVYAVAVSSNDVYVGGNFTRATNNGGISISANRIAKWNGNAWSSLGMGIDGSVRALAVSGTNLYVGGTFVRVTNTGGASIIANRIAKWDGSTWSPVGSGMSSDVYALAVVGNDVYAGGVFATSGGSPASRIAKWDGSVWSALGSGVNDTVNALGVFGSDLYVGGKFTVAGNKVSANFAKAYIGAARGQFTNVVYSPTTGFSCTFLDASVGQPYRIQSAPALAGPWTDFTNFVYTGPVVISDPAPLAGTNKFFRAVTP
jgi:hypothetical protein